MSGLWDTHVHLQDPVFEDDLQEVLERSRLSGIEHMVLAGVDEHDFECLPGMIDRIPGSLFALGIHPLRCEGGITEPGIEDLLSLLCEKADKFKPHAIGEIGLDKKAGFDEEQRILFRGQLALARGLDLPVLLHCRKRFGGLVEILRSDGLPARGGVYHAFSGSIEMYEEIRRLGLRLGIGGVLTFKNSEKMRKIVSQLPLDSFVLETDSPDITPEPYRGKRNEPAFLKVIFESLCRIRPEDAEELKESLNKNCMELFNINKNYF